MTLSVTPHTLEGWNSASANMVFVVCTLYCTIAVLHVPWTKTTVVFYSFMCLTAVFQRVPRSGLDEEKQGGKSPKYLFNDGKI